MTERGGGCFKGEKGLYEYVLKKHVCALDDTLRGQTRRRREDIKKLDQSFGA